MEYDWQTLLDDWVALGKPDKYFVYWVAKKEGIKVVDLPKSLYEFLATKYLWKGGSKMLEFKSYDCGETFQLCIDGSFVAMINKLDLLNALYPHLSTLNLNQQPVGSPQYYGEWEKPLPLKLNPRDKLGGDCD